MQFDVDEHVPRLGLKVKVSEQSVQKVADPAHSIQGDSHLLQFDPTLVNPFGQAAMQAPFKKTPFPQLQTPFTGLNPLGHVATHCPFDKKNPFKHVLQTDRSALQVLHGKLHYLHCPAIGMIL